MKSLCYILVALAVCMAARAQVLTDVAYPAGSAYTADYAVMATLTSPNTNSFSITNRVDCCLYSTIHIYNSTNLNGFSFVVDRSLDSTNWIAGATNTVPGSTNGGISEATFTGKYGFLRVRTFGTNIVGGITYLGGR